MDGAERELRMMIQGQEKKRGMKWQFTTPLALHHNGSAETMVQSVKTALKCAILDTKLTPFELYTYLLKEANLVNQRQIGCLKIQMTKRICVSTTFLWEEQQTTFDKVHYAEQRIPNKDSNSVKVWSTRFRKRGRVTCFQD